MTILVTGAAGYVGRNFLRIAQEEPVVGIDASNLLQGPLPPLNNLVTFHKVDLLDRDAAMKIVHNTQPRAIVHLAAHSASGGNSEAFAQNAMMTLNLLLAARKLRARPHVVLAGSAAEYGETTAPADETQLPHPVDAYGTSKLTTTLMATAFGLEYGLPTCVLRFGNIYGPGQTQRFVANMIEAALTVPGVLTLTANGRPRRPWLYLTDALAALRWGLSAEGIYNVAESNASLSMVARTVIQHAQDEMATRGVVLAPEIKLLPTPGGIERLEMDCSNYESASGARFVSLDRGIRQTVIATIKDRSDGHH